MIRRALLLLIPAALLARWREREHRRELARRVALYREWEGQ